MADKLPAMPFYVGDWQKDPGLRRSSKTAKGVWMDILCLMWECEERGVLFSNGNPWPDEDIAAAVGGDTAENLRALHELLDKGVARRRADGAVFSERMVRDELKRTAAKENGQKGGNPDLKGDDKAGVNRGVNHPHKARVKPPRARASVSVSDAVSGSAAGENGGEKDTAAAAAPTGAGETGTAVVTPRQLQPHQDFVERWKKTYAALNDGKTYQDDKADYVLTAELIKKHGLDACIQKAQILAVLCKKKSAWFTKEGGGCFTIGKLRSRWNEIVEQSHQPSEEDEARAAMKRQEDLRARAHHV